MGNKTHRINTTCAVSDSAKLLNFLYWNKNLSNLNYLFLPLPQYSIRLVTFDFQSFIRLEKRLRILKKIENFSENFTSFTHSPHQIFSRNFTSSTTLTTPNSQKNTSLSLIVVINLLNSILCYLISSVSVNLIDEPDFILG